MARIFRRKKVLWLVLLAAVVVFTLAVLQSSGNPTELRAPVMVDVVVTPSNTADVSGYVSGQVKYLNFIISDNVTKPSPTCSPIHNIAFLKTHKAGSSTVTSILQRYGMTRNLQFALPDKPSHTFAYNYLSKPGGRLTLQAVIPLLPGKEEYNILCNHAVYNRTAFRLIMPSDTVYISILREPFSQVESIFEYYGVIGSLARVNPSIRNFTNPLSEFFSNPYKYEKGNVHFSYLRNKQAEDFGLSVDELFSPSKFDEYLQQLSQDFLLVMIMEYFDESLLLLKHALCWDTKDILFIPKNKNGRKPRRNFTDEDRKRHRKLSSLDYKLYDFFLKRLQDELSRQSEDFFQELDNFRSLLTQVKHTCETKSSFFYVTATRWYDAFNVTAEDCNILRMPELVALDVLLKRARPPVVTPTPLSGSKIH
ncbi:galactose-3-O-sulfotransferase 2 isoform X2 [Aplysia californica]|nr:galactose-3-O-sulfotransferase 2 isoform X2 [Aplysia californica]XP_005094088.1 galactose-3-O-sulfotransferase 2 isoform X2 [Aplysia californica]XP_005094089.1 galactose-3-O-sulfotransferase 2 isoform X2 [Aplysia californica]